MDTYRIPLEAVRIAFNIEGGGEGMPYISMRGPGYIRLSPLSGRTSPAKGGHRPAGISCHNCCNVRSGTIDVRYSESGSSIHWKGLGHAGFEDVLQDLREVYLPD